MRTVLFFLLFIFCLSCSSDLKIYQVNKKNKGIDRKGKNIPPGYQHKDGLWFEKDKHDTYFDLANYLYNGFIKKNNFKTILELGSGAGSLAYHLRKLDPNLIVVTIDGNKKTSKSPYVKSNHHFIARTDENIEFFDRKKNRIIFDFIISFEHFEHIEDGKFQNLIDNIKKHIDENTLCFCSAASWGPGAYEPHCNVKTLNEWEKYLSAQDFEIIDTSGLKDMPAPFNFEWDRSHKLLFRLSTR